MLESTPTRTWRFPGRMLAKLLRLTVLLWGIATLALGALLAAIAIFGSVEISAMAEADGVVAPFVGFTGGYLLHTLLPAHVAHGQTRRDFGIQVAIIAPLFVLAVALLMQVSFVLEWALYSAMDWPREVSSEHLYSSATELPLVFTEHMLFFLVWFAAGGFVGAAFYRASNLGAVSIPLALVPVSAAGIAVRGEWGPLGPLYEHFAGGPADLQPAAAALIALGSALAAGCLAWLTFRDIPIRSQTR